VALHLENRKLQDLIALLLPTTEVGIHVSVQEVWVHLQSRQLQDGPEDTFRKVSASCDSSFRAAQLSPCQNTMLHKDVTSSMDMEDLGNSS
jgi:hypothetical protein